MMIDLVRSPRDVLTSVKAFTANGVDGFARQPGVEDQVYAVLFADRLGAGLQTMLSNPSVVRRRGRSAALFSGLPFAAMHDQFPRGRHSSAGR